MATINFDSTNIDPAPRFDPIPAGDYPAIVTASQMKQTKTGTGSYLELELQIQDGEFSGRKLFDRLNLDNENRQTVEIAQRQLSQICHAVGVLQVADSEQLHFKPLTAIVALKPAKGEYSASNEVKGYKAAQGAPVSAQFQAPRAGVPPQQFTPPPQASAQIPPWLAARQEALRNGCIA